MSTLENRKRILVVDDDEQVLIVWRDALLAHAEQWRVETARSGYEALEKIRAGGFDLIVTDLRMPGIDGCDVTIAARQLLGDVPVIWITAYPERGAETRAETLAVHNMLTKPLSVAQIRGAVAEALA